MEPTLCFIREEYFKKNSSFVKMLDVGNTDKQSKRTHVCVLIEANNNKFYVPLRNNLGDEVRKFGRIGHSVPSKKRKDAGLDYRYTLIVNDDAYIELQTEQKIPESQYRIIQNDYKTIKDDFIIFLNGFLKAAKKKRIDKEPLYRESSLINFKNELGLNVPIDISNIRKEGTPMKNHMMKLNPSPFKMIREGNKTIELRLYDEKRKLISIGDIITFTNTEDSNYTLCVKVMDLFVFPSFDELYKNLPLLECGYTKEDIATASPSDMEEYYSKEMQQQYGVVGIKISLLNESRKQRKE